jgi:myo-inositol-1(or 4)-monophosphatase
MENYLNIAKKAAFAAGGLQREQWGSVKEIDYKGEIDLVTEVDQACEKIIIDTLRSECPTHEILAEESGVHQGTSDYRWIVDPLDGTTNYAHGYPCFCVSIALEYRGLVQVGLVYEPILDEMFEATRGRGAMRNGQSIRVSSVSTLKQSLLATGFAYDVREAADTNLEHFATFIMNSQAVRRDGAAAVDLAYVACGRYDGFWELNLQPWDVAAGTLILEEAGGKVSLFDGSAFDMNQKQIVATNAKIHQVMLKHIQDDIAKQG